MNRGRPKKVIPKSYPDKLIRTDFILNEKQVTIQYLGDISNLRNPPQLKNGEVYSKDHTHAVIINSEYKCFI